MKTRTNLDEWVKANTRATTSGILAVADLKLVYMRDVRSFEPYVSHEAMNAAVKRVYGRNTAVRLRTPELQKLADEHFDRTYLKRMYNAEKRYCGFLNSSFDRWVERYNLAPHFIPDSQLSGYVQEASTATVTNDHGAECTPGNPYGLEYDEMTDTEQAEMLAYYC